MAGSERRTIRGGCRPRSVPLAMLLALACTVGVACGPGEGRSLRVAGLVPLVDELARTLAVDSGGRFWLGLQGELRILSPAGEPVRRIGLPHRTVPEVVGWADGRAYVRTGDSLRVLGSEHGQPIAVRGALGDVPLLVEVRERALLQGARSGAVLAHDPRSLEPLWAWPALAVPTTGLAQAPEGDRVYQALGGEDVAARLLLRDLQTGRELSTMALPDPLQQLVTDEEGRIFGVARERREVVVVALDPRGLAPEVLWRRSLVAAEAGADVRLAAAGGRLAVWGLGPRVGIRLLDADDGRLVGRTRTDPLDLWMRGGTELWTLYPGELRRLE